MAAPFLLAPEHYPARVRDLSPGPSCIWLTAEIPPGPLIAIVGTRRALPEAEAFAFELAAAVTAAGGSVCSGGALGIDTAAHRGALSAGGRTCVVLPTGHAHTYPGANASLFEEIAAAGGALVWPFPPTMVAYRANFLRRNAVLVALSDAVVVVQAGIPSGALNAAACARRLGRPLYAVAAPPWLGGFEGSTAEVNRGARAVTSTGQLLRELGLAGAHERGDAAPQMTPETRPARPSPGNGRGPGKRRAASAPSLFAVTPSVQEPLRTEGERRLLDAVRSGPKHKDELEALTALPKAALATALLTLSLEHVLVEGSDGLFRWNIPDLPDS